MDKKKNMRFSDEEFQLIKNTFAENFEILVALRKLFLQIEMTESEKVLIQSLNKPEIVKLLRKIYLPEIDANAPLHQVIDLWMTVKLEDKAPADAVNILKAREIVIGYLDQQLKALEGEVKEEYKLADLTKIMRTHNDTVINFTARNTIIQHTEFQLAVISNLAGQKLETVDETKKRLMQDSSK